MRILEIITTFPITNYDSAGVNYDSIKLYESRTNTVVDNEDIQYLQRVWKGVVVSPVIGNKYIPLQITLIGTDDVILEGRKTPRSIISITDTHIIFENGVDFIKEYKGLKVYSKLFLFESSSKFKDFEMMMRMRFNNLQNTLKEDATAGATSAGNIATVANPHVAIGRDRKNKSYTGSPGKPGTKSPALPKVTTPKNSDGTAKNAQDLKGVNIFGGGAVKR